ncbi:MAG: PQQ-like beta-propeller repeat protein [Lentisphaeria bacterium]|nr:PQQ-like beta-propeller repeat protein [Lentisphaeria bacterium]
MGDVCRKPALTRQVLACACAVAIVHVLASAVFLLANHRYSRHVNPLENAALEQLKKAVSLHPKDEELREAFRILDRDVRHEFHRSRTLAQRGGWVLGGGLLVLALAGGGLAVAGIRPARPEPLSPQAQDENAAIRAGLLSGLAALGVFSVILLLPSGSDEPAVTEPIDSAESAPAFDAFAGQWPSFRGCGGVGVATATELPLRWNGKTGAGIAWKITPPLAGFSSPVIWDDRIYLTGADNSTREMFCFNLEDGALLWRHPATGVAGSPAELPEVTEDTGFAAATPTTDGAHVFAIFATGDVLCTDRDGKRLWARNLGVPDNPYGHASSLMLHHGRLLVQYDHFGRSRFLALDAADGETVWECEREVSASWASPVLAKTESRYEVYLNAEPFVTAYDADSGQLLWQVECMSGEVGPSPGYGNGMAYFTTDYAVLAAVHTGADPKAGAIAWQVEDDLPDVSSPVVAGGLVFIAASSGILTCHDAKTGERKWQQEYENGFYSSPVVGGDRLYLADMNGLIHVIRVAATFSELASNPLGEPMVATPAMLKGRILLRGARHLYCVTGTGGE